MEKEKALERFITETARTLASHKDTLAGHTSELKKIDAEFKAFHEAMKKRLLVTLDALVKGHEDLLAKLDAEVRQKLAEREGSRVEHCGGSGGVN